MAAQMQLVDANGHPQWKPDFIDVANDPVIYEGYKVEQWFHICKLDTSGGNVSRTWAKGNWDDRLTLSYS